MDDYQCKDRFYHDYQQKGEDDSVLVEVCHRCSREIRFPKDAKGRVNNFKYLKAHGRDFLQEHDKRFKEEWVDN